MGAPPAVRVQQLTTSRLQRLSVGNFPTYVLFFTTDTLRKIVCTKNGSAWNSLPLMIDAYKEQNHQNPRAKQNEHQPAKVVPLLRRCLVELFLGETLLRDESLTAPQRDHSGVSFVLRQEKKS